MSLSRLGHTEFESLVNNIFGIFLCVFSFAEAEKLTLVRTWQSRVIVNGKDLQCGDHVFFSSTWVRTQKKGKTYILNLKWAASAGQRADYTHIQLSHKLVPCLHLGACLHRGANIMHIGAWFARSIICTKEYGTWGRPCAHRSAFVDAGVPL